MSVGGKTFLVVIYKWFKLHLLYFVLHEFGNLSKQVLL